MNRKQLIAALKAAGATSDQRAFLRLYTENRISLAAAREAFNEGYRFAQAIARRDAMATTEA